MTSWKQLRLKYFTFLLAALFIASLTISAIWITKAEASRKELIAEQQQSEQLHLAQIRGIQAKERLKQLVDGAKNKHPKIRKSWIKRRNQRERDYINEIVNNADHAYHRIHYNAIYQPRLDSNVEVILFVYSTVTAMGAGTRKAIRETWAEKKALTKHRVSLSFVLGKRAKPNDAELRVQESHLDEEYNRYGDLLLFDFIDSYQNLTVKSVSMLRWFLTTPHTAKYLIKCDSDVLLNIDNMIPLILKTNKISPNFVLGHNMNVTAPAHQISSKWFVPLALYSKLYYPEFVSGTSYAMSKTAAALISRNIASIHYLYLEDVFLTGLCRYGTGISLVHSDQFIISQPDTLTDAWDYSVSVHGYAGLGADIRRNWQLIAERKTTLNELE